MVKVDPYSYWGTNGDEDFDNLLSLLDFPMESLEGDGLDWDISKLQNLGPIPTDELSSPPMIAQPKIEPVFLHGQVGLNDIAPEMKQLPYRFEEIPGSCIRRQYEVQEQSAFQSQSPVSVLENGAGKNSLVKSHVNKRTRSKRARPSVNPWLLLSPVFSSGKNRETRKKPSHVERAKKTVADFADARNAAPQRPPAAKKCAHCEVTKTPQWREGPMGPKTLCNACGVRYRSGRLYPEYRPAASPTFVPSVHSNSHKKVVEMRTKAKQHKVIDVEDSSMFGDFEFIPVSGYL